MMQLGNAFELLSLTARLAIAATAFLHVRSTVLAADELSEAAANYDRCNVVWTSPSKTALETMPLGNGDIGINAWVEPSGDLVFYVSKTDAWDELGRLCKIGRVRVQFDPPLSTNAFCQQLKLREGVIQIESRIQKSEVNIRLWVDANQPVVRLEADSAQPVICKATVELWRLRERPVAKDEDSRSSTGLENPKLNPDLKVLPDVVASVADEPRVVWYHRNTQSVYGLGLAVEHLENLKDQFTDPLLNRTFGASLTGPGFVAEGRLGLKSGAAARRHELAVTVLQRKTDTPDVWLAELGRLEKQCAAGSLEDARRAHEAWWSGFWNRSWIFVGGCKEAEAVTRGYVLHRFMQACAGRGGAPIKFNGSIFTVPKTPGADPETPEGNPDWRRWGGNYWAYNTRPSYWAMLAAGDFEMMEPWFRMYHEALPLQKARIQSYYGFENAAQFPEVMYWWGLPCPDIYGWNNKSPELVNTYLRYHWVGNLELLAVMLDRYELTQDEEFVRSTLVPLAEPIIAFVDQYRRKRDPQGKILFEPAQAMETYQTAVNPMTDIAGLHYVLPRLLALPEPLTQAAERSRWRRMLGDLPPLPAGNVCGKELLRRMFGKNAKIDRYAMARVDGEKLLLPADFFFERRNFENPELYPIFPFRLYGVGKPDIELARRSYAVRPSKSDLCLTLDNVQAACLGLAEEAGRQIVNRAMTCNYGYRFPAMCGPGVDWIPDQCHAGNVLTALQYMLLQWDGEKIFVLPAWPKDWDVAFKLHAPRHTTVEGIYRGGKIERLEAQPSARQGALEIMRKDLAK